MATHTFDYALFQQQIPAYATTPAESVIAGYWDIATTYIPAVDNFCGGLQGNGLQLVLNLLTAHLIYQGNLIAKGQTAAIVTSSTIDKVSVSLMEPPVKGMFQYWLATTPYGQQLLAMLTLRSSGGWNVSKGLPERRAFRKVGGTFR